MSVNFVPGRNFSYYFPGDNSGFVAYCETTGDTHFINAPTSTLRELLARPQFSSREMQEYMDQDEDASHTLQEKLISIGIIKKTTESA